MIGQAGGRRPLDIDMLALGLDARQLRPSPEPSSERLRGIPTQHQPFVLGDAGRDRRGIAGQSLPFHGDLCLERRLTVSQGSDLRAAGGTALQLPDLDVDLGYFLGKPRDRFFQHGLRGVAGVDQRLALPEGRQRALRGIGTLAHALDLGLGEGDGVMTCPLVQPVDQQLRGLQQRRRQALCFGRGKGLDLERAHARRGVQGGRYHPPVVEIESLRPWPT